MVVLAIPKRFVEGLRGVSPDVSEGRCTGSVSTLGSLGTVFHFVPVASKIDAVSTSFHLTMAVVKRLALLGQPASRSSNLRMILQPAAAATAGAFVLLAFRLTGPGLGYFHARQKPSPVS